MARQSLCGRIVLMESCLNCRLFLRLLCNLQVPEDGGEFVHPLRLTNATKITNPYTNTIYRKVRSCLEHGPGG